MPLLDDYNNDNVFAKIIRGEMPCYRIYEDESVLSFLDIFPKSEGHAIVIPKKPSRNLLGLNSKDIGRVFGAVQRISKAVNNTLSPDGIIITQLNGSAAGQTVFHSHVHIIPCYNERIIINHNDKKPKMDEEKLSILAKKIASKL
jgi:histidine triad (HIT) family protein